VLLFLYALNACRLAGRQAPETAVWPRPGRRPRNEGTRAVATDDLNQADAVRIVAASVRRLFTVVSEQQSQDLVSVVLADLRAQGIRLVQEAGAFPSKR